MKKLRLFLLAFFSLGLLLGANGQQDTIKNLIISEHRAGLPFNCYIELTNLGTETVDLSKITLANVVNKILRVDETGQWRINSAPGSAYQTRLSGTIAPSASWVIMNVSDRLAPNGLWPDHRLDLLAIADTIIHSVNSFGVSDTIVPEWEMWGFDSLSVSNNLFWNWGNMPYVLFNHLENGDSIMIDQVKLDLNESGSAINAYSDVAGIPNASRDNTLVRKANITTGNLVWADQKGTSAENSEWLLLPTQPQNSRISFTTVKTHGDFHVDVSSSVVDVDKPNAKMTVPWGIYKRDSILPLLELGPGQAWEYVLNSSIIDSTHSIIQDGDMLRIYAAGNVIDEVDFELTVAEAAADEARVYPMLYKATGGTYWTNPYTQQYEWNENDRWIQPYYVTVGEPVIDTIGNVAYATRVDTLFKYLEKAPLANWEIVWKDGVVRADLQNGDKLMVTAENGTTTKEYYIDVLDYAFSDNVDLTAITWPDKSEFLEDWNNDTIPQFSRRKYIYTVMVPYGSKNVPALVAHPAYINSKLSVKRAVSLTGSLEERSTVFTVTSESDTLSQNYTVVFELEKDPSKVQVYKGTPFISELANYQRSAMSYIEIVNPGNVELDMSEYLILRSHATNVGGALAEAVFNPATVTDASFKNRYRSYVPGYKFHEDTLSWLIEPGILALDGDVNPMVKPGDVFVLAATWANREQFLTDYLRSVIRKGWHAIIGNTDELGVVPTQTPPAYSQRDALWLFHIDNDSVLEGKKPVGDPADYTVVDVIGDPVSDNKWSVAGRPFNNAQRARMRAKSYVYTGARTLIESAERFGTNADNSDWIVEEYAKELVGQDNIPDLIGSHAMDPVTVYLSTVTSSVYLVSDGYGNGQSIRGDLTSTTVESFFGNVAKADTGQTLNIHSGVDGSIKDPASAVVGNDTLVVVSADGLNTSRYALTDLPLDTNAVLTTDDTNLTISNSGATGTITGVVYGSLLKDLVAAVNVPPLAVMNIINGDGELIPMTRLDNNLVKVDTKIGNDVYLEVTAQDRITIITYKLEPVTLSSDAYVISSLYTVDQDNDLIEGVAGGTATTLFFNNIEVVEGASATLYTKLGHERLVGILAFDDVLQVVSEDGTVTRTYFINFMNETTPDSNRAPEIMLAFSDSTIAVPGTLLLSATADDDGLPPPANLTYLWEVTSDNAADVDIETPDALATNVTFNAKGVYTLSLSVSDGALVSKADVVVTVGIVGVNNSITPAMRLYPNPAKNKLTIELTNMPEKTSVVSIINVTGSVVYNSKLSNVTNEIDISGLQSGLYFIKIDSGNQRITHRFEIQN